jgi:hypothetical protein
VDYHVVGRVETLAFEPVDQNRQATVVLRACHSPSVVLAGNQSALPVPSIAVAIGRGLAKHGNLVRCFAVTQHAVIGNIAENQATEVAEPDGAFKPTPTRVETFHRRIPDAILGEARIQNFDSRIGISNYSAIPPVSEFSTPIGSYFHAPILRIFD